MDLAAGSGEATLALKALHPAATFHAIDPYTSQAYTARTGWPCENLTFEQISTGALRDRRYSLIVCSFAMHLVEPSRLPSLCMELATLAPQLLILTPHKRPIIKPAWNWELAGEILYLRVRARFYRSCASRSFGL